MKNRNPKQKINYLICATPRSGSSLLCNLMANTGIVGKNNSERISTDLIKSTDWNKVDLKEFFKKIFGSTSTPNGVSGFKIQGHQIKNLVKELNKTHRYRKVSVNNIIKFFPKNLKYIWLSRKDKVRQAISLSKVWKSGILFINKKKKRRPPIDIAFDSGSIMGAVEKIREEEVIWRNFFEKNKIEPLKLEYEEVTRDFRGTLIKILNYFEVPVPKSLIVKTYLLKQSDELSEKWIERYYKTSYYKKIPSLYKYKFFQLLYEISYKLRQNYKPYNKFIDFVKEKLRI